MRLHQSMKTLGVLVLQAFCLFNVRQQQLWGQHIRHGNLMTFSFFFDVERSCHIKNSFPFLKSNDTARGKTSSVSDGIHMKVNWNIDVPAQNKIPVHGVRYPIFWNRLIGCVKGLAQYLTPKNTSPRSFVILTYKIIFVFSFKSQ